MAQQRRGPAFLYFGPVVMQALVGLVSMPFLVRSVGLDAYSDIAVGQAIGSVFWILLSLGYQSTGPTQIAAVEAGEATRLYRRSVWVRVACSPLIIGLVIASCLVLRPEHLVLMLSFALAAAAGGLITSWFFIGVIDPIGSIAFEAAPRLLPMMAGLIITAFTGNVWAFVLGQFLGVLLSSIATRHYVRRRAPYGRRPTFASCLEGFRGQLRMTMISAGYAALASAPLMIVASGAFSARNDFVILDKLQKQASAALMPISSLLMARAAHPQAVPFARRLDAVARTNAKALALIGVALALLGAPMVGAVADAVSSGTVQPGRWESVIFASWVSASVVAQAWQTCVLVPAKRERSGLIALTATGIGTLATLALVTDGLALSSLLALMLLGQVLPVLLTSRATTAPDQLSA